MNSAKILVVGPSWVGDMVMAHSLFQVLKRQQPQAVIEVLAPPWSAPLLARMPEVERVIAQPLAHGHLELNTRYALGRSLRSENYTQAIVLPNSFKSALIPWWARIPQRTGFLGEWRYFLLNDVRPLNKGTLYRTVDRFVALSAEPSDALAAVPRPYLRVESAQAQATAQRLQLNTERPVLALCPGAEYGAAKRWPQAHYATVARAKIAQGWQVWLLGSRKDAPVGQAIAVLTGKHCENLCGHTQLAEAIALLSLATAVVSNDSGLMHVAAALDKPLVALYGSSDPLFTPPLSDKAQIISLGLACSPCFKRQCPLEHLRCLRDITPEQVLALI